MPTNSYLGIAQAYADGVRLLFTPPSTSIGERGRRGPTSYEDLAEQAEALSSLSTKLGRAAEDQLADDAPIVRAQASTRLLAKALTDLQVSAYLLQAAMDEEEGVAWAESTDRERRCSVLEVPEERLQLLLGGAEKGSGAEERGEALPRDVPAAREMLSQAIEDALHLISERAGQLGQMALRALLGLSMTQIGQAVAIVGLDVAQLPGQTEKVSRLYDLFRDFAIEAYNTVVALLGPQLSQTAGRQVMNWVAELKEGTRFGDMLEKLYGVERSRRELAQLVCESEADLKQFVAAIQSVNGLDAAYRQQVDLAEKLLRGLTFLALVPTAALPQGQLLMTSAFVILVAYVILTSADYVDAARLRLLDRVPGVRRVVEANL